MGYSKYIERALKTGNSVKENADRVLTGNAVASQSPNNFWNSRTTAQITGMADDATKAAEFGSKALSQATSIADPAARFVESAAPVMSKAAVAGQLLTMGGEAIGNAVRPQSILDYRDKMQHESNLQRMVEGFEHPITSMQAATNEAVNAGDAWLGAMKAVAQEKQAVKRFTDKYGFAPGPIPVDTK
jgi:hypothetical protein